MMNMKRGRKGVLEIDRLSSLPDCLLITIISFLELKEGVKTCVLSKQWKSLWRSACDLPRLELKERSGKREQIAKFVGFVNERIIGNGNGRRRRGCRLQDFHVELYYMNWVAADVDAWVEYAVRNKVENLSLIFGRRRHSLEFYTPPPLNYRCLRSLSLVRVHLTQDQLEFLLLGCPVLESFELGWCWMLHRVAIRIPGFRRLHCYQSIGLLGMCLQEISAPDMRELNVGLPVDGLMPVVHAPNLDKATLRLLSYHRRSYTSDTLYRCIKAYTSDTLCRCIQIFRDISHVNELHLECHAAQVITRMAETGFKLPQFRLHNLFVRDINNLHKISGIIALLKSSPKLEKLVISRYIHDDDDSEAQPNEEEVFVDVKLDCELLQLKYVDIEYCGHITSTVSLAQIILERAPALVEMVIRNTSTLSHHLITPLLLCPKAAPLAKLLIHQ